MSHFFTASLRSLAVLFILILGANIAAAQIAVPNITDFPDKSSLAFDALPDPMVDTPLDEAALKTFFIGKTHYGRYSHVPDPTTSPLFIETVHTDGYVDYMNGDGKLDPGHWHFKGNKICYQHDGFSPDYSCAVIFKRGNCYYHLFENASFIGGVSIIKGDNPSCEAAIS